MLIGLFVEADEHDDASADRGSAQVAGGTEHGVDGVIAGIRGVGEFGDLAAPGDDQQRCAAQQFGRVAALQLAARGNRFGNLDAVSLQEPGGTIAGGSSLAVVVPVGAGHVLRPPGFELLHGECSPACALL